jgi:hypothetical protein
MNLALLSRFSKNRRTNSVLVKIDQLRQHPIFRGARIDVYLPTLQPEKLIIVLGQAHTVWRGKIGNRERRKIVNCQARLCSYYAYFEQFQGIKSFGGEGIYDGLETSFHDRISFKLYDDVAQGLHIEQPVPLEKLNIVAQSILADLGRQWHGALRQQQDLKKIQTLAAAVSGYSLFNFLNQGRIKVYPIEGEAAYQKVLIGISHLGDRIEKLENSFEMQSIIQRGGTSKNEKEAQVVTQYNALVREFNHLIGSDIRERATMEIVRQKADQEGVVVMTMGVGHRHNYFQLVEEYLGSTNKAFVFITAPELLLNWWLLIGAPLLILGLVLGLNWWITGG